MEYIKRLSKDSEKQIIAGGLEKNIKTWRKSDTEIGFFFFLLTLLSSFLDSEQSDSETA